MLTLPQALAALAGRGLAAITIDIKDGPPFGTDGFARAVLHTVAAARCSECIIWAKADEVVSDLLDAGGGLTAGFVLMNQTADARAHGMHRLNRLPGAAAVAAHWGMVDAALVAAARARGLRVYGWTANEEHMADAIISAGAFAVVTDKVRSNVRIRCVALTPRPLQPTMVQQRMDAIRAACS